MSRLEKVIRAEVDSEFKTKVQERAKQERKTERQILIKAVNLLLETPVKKFN